MGYMVGIVLLILWVLPVGTIVVKATNLGQRLYGSKKALEFKEEEVSNEDDYKVSEGIVRIVGEVIGKDITKISMNPGTVGMTYLVYGKKIAGTTVEIKDIWVEYYINLGVNAREVDHNKGVTTYFFDRDEIRMRMYTKGYKGFKKMKYTVEEINEARGIDYDNFNEEVYTNRIDRLVDLVQAVEYKENYEELFAVYGEVFRNVESSIVEYKDKIEKDLPQEMRDKVAIIIRAFREELNGKVESESKKKEDNKKNQAEIIMAGLGSSEKYIETRKRYQRDITGEVGQYSLEEDIEKTLEEFKRIKERVKI